MKFTATTLLLGLILVVAATGALAHKADDDHAASSFTKYGEQLDFGRVGKATEVKRTIEMDMKDSLRFTPARLEVRSGETVRLVFRNVGVQIHEWVIGTPAEIVEHADLMRRFPNMEHDVPHNVHVPPGETRELVWQFNRPGTFEYACLLPGHFEAGMKGMVEVK